MDFSNDIESSLSVLQQGGVILYPTDTVWGLGCDATNPAAVDKIFSIKKRAAENRLIILLADERDILKYVSQVDLQVFDYLETVKKPTTVIYEGAIGIADNAINKDGTAAIRLVKEDFCRHLLKRFRKPIVSTSANISGEPSPRNFSSITESIKRSVGYIVQYRQQDDNEVEPSAIVRWKAGKVEVLRT
jgi:L-threonylcarbamoyladenylate synthase